MNMIPLIINSLENAEDQQLIENLYNKYMPWLRCRANKYVKDLNICDDLAHDCILNMIKNVETLKTLAPDKQRSYMLVSINNISKNYIKHSSKIVTMNEDSSAELDFIPDQHYIDDVIDKKCDYETLRLALTKLSERDQDIINMKFDLELDEQQIAEALQIKKDCVRMTVFRSVQKLKTEIAKLEGQL